MSSKTLDHDLALIVGNTRRKRRSINIPDLAKAIERVADNLGSLTEVSERIILSNEMLRQFLTVNNLDPQVYEMFVKRELDSVDLCSQLATLEPADQKVIAQNVLDGALNTKNVRDFRELRRRDPSSTAESLIAKVQKAKSRVKYVAEFTVAPGTSIDGLLGIFQRKLPSSGFVELDINGPIAKLAVDKLGRDALRDIGSQKGYNLEQTIQLIASENI